MRTLGIVMGAAGIGLATFLYCQYYELRHPARIYNGMAAFMHTITQPKRACELAKRAWLDPKIARIKLATSKLNEKPRRLVSDDDFIQEAGRIHRAQPAKILRDVFR